MKALVTYTAAGQGLRVLLIFSLMYLGFAAICSGQDADDPSEPLAKALNKAAYGEIRRAGFHVTADAALGINELIEQGLTTIAKNEFEAKSRLGDLAAKEQSRRDRQVALQNIRKFSSGLVAYAMNGVITLDVFQRVRASFCPLYPFC